MATESVTTDPREDIRLNVFDRKWQHDVPVPAGIRAQMATIDRALQAACAIQAMLEEDHNVRVNLDEDHDSVDGKAGALSPFHREAILHALGVTLSKAVEAIDWVRDDYPKWSRL